MQRQDNNIRTQIQRVSQFTTTGSQLVNSGEIIILSNTQYNNISDSVALNNGSVSLLNQGVYEIEYNVTVSNPQDADLDIIIQLVRQGVTPLVLSQAIVTLTPNATATISNTFIDPVFSGTDQQIQLINASSEPITVVSANIVINKLT